MNNMLDKSKIKTNLTTLNCESIIFLHLLTLIVAFMFECIFDGGIEKPSGTTLGTPIDEASDHAQTLIV